MVQERAPAEDSHDEFRGERVIRGGESGVGFGVQEFGGVRRFALDAEEDVERGGAGGGYGHCGIVRKAVTTGGTEGHVG